MKILIDGRPVQTYSRFRGIGRYVNQLINVFGRNQNFTFLFFKGKDVPDNTVNRILTKSPRRGITFTDRYYIPYLLKKNGFNIYHSTGYALPGRVDGVRYLITFFDMTPVKFPEYSSKKNLLIFKKIINSMKNADKIISISHNSMKDLSEYSGAHSEKIEVVHNYVEPLSKNPVPLNIPFKDDGYILYVGGTDGNKNISTLVKTIEITGLPLVVAGKSDDRIRMSLFNLLSKRKKDLLFFTGFVSDSELASLYSNARMFVYPSIYEGFGFPPLEALLYGTPSVVSNRGSLPEVMGNAAVFCSNPLNVSSLSSEIETLWRTRRLREELVKKGKKLINNFSRDVFVKKMKELYYY